MTTTTKRLDAATLKAVIAALKVLKDKQSDAAKALEYDNVDPGRYDGDAHAAAVYRHGGVCEALSVLYQMRIDS